MRYYDMPPGQDFCLPWEMFLDHISHGRVAALVPIAQSDGSYGLYIYSGKPEKEITAENTYQHCLQMVMAARDAAQHDDFVVLPNA